MSISIIAPYEIALATGLEFYPSAGSPLVTRLVSSDYQSIILAEPLLVSYWKMDGNWQDSKGTNHGTASGNATFGTAKYGSAAGSFDGENDYIIIPDNNNLDFTTAMTVEAWVYAVALTGEFGVSAVFTKFGGATGFDFGILNSTGKFYLNINNIELFGSTLVLSTGAWHHVAVTFSSGNVVFYMDGVPESLTHAQASIGVNINSAYIGSRTTYFDWNGRLDEVAVYNTALSGTAIANHFAATSYPTNSPAATHKFSIPGASIADIVDCLNYLENSLGGTGSLSYGYQLNGGSLVSGQTLAQLKAAVRNAAITVHTDSLIVYVSHISNGTQQVESAFKMGGGLHVVDAVSGGGGKYDKFAKYGYRRIGA